MLETILDYEKIKEILEEENKKHKIGLKKLALMHQNTILQLFNLDEYIEIIENGAIKIAENTLQLDNIDLCYIVIDKISCNIVYKNIIQNDIMREKYENYQKINNNIYTIGSKELKAELLNYSENILSKILGDTIINDTTIYNDCIGWIFEEVEKTYNNGYTIFTTDNSFILYGSYSDVIMTDFENNYYILDKNTKLFLIDEIENSDLLETVKKEIINKIKAY